MVKLAAVPVMLKASREVKLLERFWTALTDPPPMADRRSPVEEGRQEETYPRKVVSVMMLLKLAG